MELEKEEEIKYQSNTSKALILCVRTTYEPACPVCVPAASHRCLLLTGSFNTPTATLPEGFLVTRSPRRYASERRFLNVNHPPDET